MKLIFYKQIVHFYFLYTILATLLTLPTHAQSVYPEPWDAYVSDYANVLPVDEEAKVEALLTGLRRDHGVEAAVLTIRSMGQYNTGDATVEAFATNLFNAWGIGDPSKNNGVLLLFALEDRAVRIELGRGYGSEYDRAMQRIIDEQMLPRFKQEAYAQGILQGVTAMVDTFSQAKLPANQPAASNGNRSTQLTLVNSRPAPVESTPQSSWPTNLLLWGGGAVAAIGGTGAWGVRHYLRNRGRNCPHCGTPMARLDEADEDVYLDSGQQAEEFFNSIDYDVWKCPSCNAHSVYPYTNLFKRLQRCPRCNYRTISVSNQMLDEPTEYSAGHKEVISDCLHCDYRHSEIVILPRVERNNDDDNDSSFWSSGDSSSSSSFSGGSSSGSGASGKW